MKILKQTMFDLMLEYIRNDFNYDDNKWFVDSLLSNIYMPETFFDSDSPTSDPAYWYDWKELVEEALEEDKSILDEKNGLTVEQGLVAMQYFLEQKYWLKNKDMLLKDAYDDLIKEYHASKNNLESSKLWKEWLVAVSEGKKFNKTFQGE